MAPTGAAGAPAAGRTAFAERCASCHATDRDLAAIVRTSDASGLRAGILEPTAFRGPQSFNVDRLRDATATSGRRAHQALLENYTAPDVANLVAYLQTMK
jgi:mono/diheme cytochrome c family protein